MAIQCIIILGKMENRWGLHQSIRPAWEFRGQRKFSILLQNWVYCLPTYFGKQPNLHLLRDLKLSIQNDGQGSWYNYQVKSSKLNFIQPGMRKCGLWRLFIFCFHLFCCPTDHTVSQMLDVKLRIKSLVRINFVLHCYIILHPYRKFLSLGMSSILGCGLIWALLFKLLQVLWKLIVVVTMAIVFIIISGPMKVNCNDYRGSSMPYYSSTCGD